ncbi:GNAT family N-acetyltransferase [Krasilnikovia sp. M28-CT-15]|uniref:GNAT family N-acetyltransferase n=1 Tax=Krasilnikovia sp. M28-CT-15 TaxID=3373540 RepID=UPI0038760788
MIVPTIEGDAIRLRGYRPDDLDAVAAGLADPLTQRFMPSLPAPFERRHAESFIRTAAPEAFALGGCAYAIADPASDRLLGGVGLVSVVPARQQAELGYWVAPHARGRGVATAAVRALTGHAFTAAVARLELLTHWENAASQRVALATGFRREGVRRGAAANRDGGRDDLLAYGRLADDPPGPTERLLPDLPGGELTDGVVTLRPLTGDDIGFYTELHTLPDVVATIVPPVPPGSEEIRRRCARAPAHWLNGDRADLVVVDTASGAPAGSLGLFYQEPVTGQAMIGYSMLPAFRGRGHQTRAVQLLALWAFAETGIARLVAGTLPDNAGSQRVLEKAGFQREAFLRSRLPGVDGRRSDDVQFALLAEDLVREAAGLDR